MASYNKVLLMGNLTRDPQLRTLPNSQNSVADFGLAVSRKFKGSDGQMREDVAFIDCTAFGRTGEVIKQYFAKGKPIFIEGRLKFDQWEDKQGGGKRSKLTVVVESFEFVGGRDGPGGEGGGSGEHSQSAPAPRPVQRGAGRPAQQAPQQPPYGEEQQFGEDEVPF